MDSCAARPLVAWRRPWLEQAQAGTREFHVDRLWHVHLLVAAQAPSQPIFELRLILRSFAKPSVHAEHFGRASAWRRFVERIGYPATRWLYPGPRHPRSREPTLDAPFEFELNRSDVRGHCPSVVAIRQFGAERFPRVPRRWLAREAEQVRTGDLVVVDDQVLTRTPIAGADALKGQVGIVVPFGEQRSLLFGFRRRSLVLLDGPAKPQREPVARFPLDR